MKKNLRTIKIGHGAYTGDNALKFVTTKAAAVRELRARGFTRNKARSVVNAVCGRSDGYQTCSENHIMTEVRAMNTDQAWDGYC